LYYSGVVDRTNANNSPLAAVCGFHDFARDLDNSLAITPDLMDLSFHKTKSKGALEIDSLTLQLYYKNFSTSNSGIIRIDTNGNILLQHYNSKRRRNHGNSSSCSIE
jgi:hypothetical protein